MTDTDRNRLAEEYAREYMGKIFYYCLRKTGDSHEAEDLASDITFQILTTLHEGVEILSFPRMGLADRAHPLCSMGQDQPPPRGDRVLHRPRRP